MNEFVKEKFYERKEVLLSLLVVFLIIGFFIFKDWDTVLNQEFDEMITITGHFSCLPLKSESERDPNVCALGVRSRDGSHYALDVSRVQDANTDLKAEDTIAVTGFIKPTAEADKTEWKDYKVSGVMQVNTLLRTR